MTAASHHATAGHTVPSPVHEHELHLVVFTAGLGIAIVVIVVVLLGGGGHQHPKFGVVILPTEESLVPESEFITGDKLLLTDDTLEALRVEDLVLSPHDVVRLPEGLMALVAFGAK